VQYTRAMSNVVSIAAAILLALMGCGYDRPADVPGDGSSGPTCSIDDDCTGTAGTPHCATDGVCVECTTNDQCPAEKAICDLEDRACRGCESDDQCASGVCVEADGVCAADAAIIYMRMFGADTGECTLASPCGTLPYALGKVTGTRNVIHFSGGNFGTPTATVAINRSVIIDAASATIGKPGTGPLFALTSSGTVTLEGFTVLGSATVNDPTITVGSGSTLRVRNAVLTTAEIKVNNGALDLKDVRAAAGTVTKNAVTCTSGTLTARQVDFDHTIVQTTNCQVNVSRCQFNEISDGSIGASGGVAVIENNLIIDANELSDSMSVNGVAPGSKIRFNTFVNTSGIDSDGVALNCDGTADVSNNIFAYASMHPMGGSGGTPCPSKYSLFDTVAVASHAAGEGNKVAAPATFFANRAAKDFHLGTSSPAKDASQPGVVVTEDFDGRPRPQPAGSRADVGCFEAP
jgi:hypothetical protein